MGRRLGRTNAACRPLAAVAAAAFTMILPLCALAGEQDYRADASFHVDTLPQTEAATGSFTTTVSGPTGAFAMPSEVLGELVTTDGGTDIVQTAIFNFSNASGSLDTSGGSVPLPGSLVIRFLTPGFADFGDVILPLANLGGGGMTTTTVNRFGDTWQFRVDGAQWQTATTTLEARLGTVSGGILGTTATNALGTMMGVDTRTLEGGMGELRLIAPMRVTAIRTNGGNGSFVEFPLTGSLLIPEPGLFALQLAAAAVLVAVGRQQARRRKP